MNHYRISEIKTRIDEKIEVLPVRIAKAVNCKPSDISDWEIRRKSIDSRNKPDIKWVYTVDFYSEKNLLVRKASKNLQLVDEAKEEIAEPVMGNAPLEGRPVVIGMGPCGIFAALTLAKRGYKPLVLERGPAMAERIEAIENFRKNRILDPEANMLYGEGGAGTFSDGKLGTGIKDGNIRTVLKTFADAGAGDDITYLAKPHIGTDVLRTTIVNLRNHIIELGGEVRFNTKLETLNIENGELKSITVTAPHRSVDTTAPVHSGGPIGTVARATETIPTNALVLAIGHSARDTFAEINKLGLRMEQKPFSIGVRMEHPQALIDQAQYGEEAIEKYGDLLPPADYKLSTTASNGRGVYSFCMCPGGEVVVCSTKAGELCVNGMSNRNRDSGTANSGILCTVNTDDYNNGDATDVLAGVRYQEKYEKLAFENGGSNFDPPQSSMQDFLASKATHVEASLPDYVASALKDAVPDFARKIRGYDNPDAVVTAVETRSSSPVRIVRDDAGESNIRGIFPAGEGAGYAGGITSAACDGIKAANKLIEKYHN